MRRVLVSTFFLLGCSSTPAGTNDAAPDVGNTMMDASPDMGSSQMCTAALAQIMKPVDMVSTGAVTILSDMNGVKKLYIDASAGGAFNAETNPRVYVDLATGMRVDITDVQAATSTSWDLALKRYVIFTNDGTGGPGMGGSLVVHKAFDQVTSADATGTFQTEAFVDQDCNERMDPLGGFLTTMSDWYDYDMQTMAVTPKTNTTYVIKSASGTTFKVAILDYYALPNGMMGSPTDSAHYVIQVSAL